MGGFMTVTGIEKDTAYMPMNGFTTADIGSTCRTQISGQTVPLPFYSACVKTADAIKRMICEKGGDHYDE